MHSTYWNDRVIKRCESDVHLGNIMGGRATIRSENACTRLCAELAIRGNGSSVAKSIRYICTEYNINVQHLYVHSRVSLLSWTAAGLTIIGYFSSLLTAFAIGLDRAVATIKPMKYRSWVTRKRGIVCLVAMWTLACIIVLTPLFMKLGSLDKEQPVPVIMHPPLAFPQEFIRYGSTPMIMCCLIGNALLYLAIVIAFNRVSHSTNSSASAKHSQRLTKTSVMVVSSLLICNTPITIMAALPPPTEPLQQLRTNLIYNLLLIFLLVPTFSNNFLYAWHQRDFRRAYGRLLRCGGQNAAVRPNPPADNMTNSSTHAQTTE
ncbi:hypothetical protein CAPTEDRAFT_202107 [Capitella teleta]|uniref:G-protein coupled receptors family 1 profile domain-containing protein n=1 Tax=Capitella teleta TaxID=283909 RepID=R7U400_CAPTE|nr:hypothetical protein CAPTEDRAFT_202107 [Capitella teleta]|eukprot:ELU00709.1 hypothetical protein CAPTEDRAFT_202107 [Capitella teleta]